MTARRLFINGRFLGGSATAVNDVARSLSIALGREAEQSARWQVALAVPPNLEEAAAGTGMPVRVVGRRSGIAWEQLELPSLRRIGVVAGFFNTVPLFGRGYVTMLHDAHVFTAAESYPPATRRWRRILSQRAAARGNHLLTVSEHSRDTLLALGLGAHESIGVVRNGLGDVGTVAPDPRILDRLGIAPGTIIFLGLASTLPHKNVGLLLRAFADPALSAMRLVLFGSADRAAFVDAGHPVPENVVFAGRVATPELAALYRASLAVLVPSTEEGFGLPALEGMALGAVPVVSARGALPEVVGNAGILLPPDAPMRWVQALHNLAGDPGRARELRALGREQAARFTWSAAARTTLRHIDRWYAT